MIHESPVSPSTPGVRAIEPGETDSAGRPLDRRARSGARCPTRPDWTKWAGLDDATAGEFVRRRLVDLPTPGEPPLRLGRHVILAVDLGGGLHCHELRLSR